MRIVKLDEASMKNILADMLKRDPNNYDAYTETVQEIVDKVKAEGDRAVFDYTRKFDKAQINAENIRVTEAEIKEAMEEVDPHLLKVMKKSMENILSDSCKRLPFRFCCQKHCIPFGWLCFNSVCTYSFD